MSTFLFLLGLGIVTGFIAFAGVLIIDYENRQGHKQEND